MRARGGRRRSPRDQRRLVVMDELARIAPFCTLHGKRTYPSKKAARRGMKDRQLITPEPGMEVNAYPCNAKDATGWHIGHRRMGS